MDPTQTNHNDPDAHPDGVRTAIVMRSVFRKGVGPSEGLQDLHVKAKPFWYDRRVDMLMHRTWKSKHAETADLVVSHKPELIAVIACSYGAGHGLVKLAMQLALRGRNVDLALLIDPVTRYRFLKPMSLGWWGRRKATYRVPPERRRGLQLASGQAPRPAPCQGLGAHSGPPPGGAGHDPKPAEVHRHRATEPGRREGLESGSASKRWRVPTPPCRIRGCSKTSTEDRLFGRHHIEERNTGRPVTCDQWGKDVFRPQTISRGPVHAPARLHRVRLLHRRESQGIGNRHYGRWYCCRYSDIAVYAKGGRWSGKHRIYTRNTNTNARAIYA